MGKDEEAIRAETGRHMEAVDLALFLESWTGHLAAHGEQDEAIELVKSGQEAAQTTIEELTLALKEISSRMSNRDAILLTVMSLLVSTLIELARTQPQLLGTVLDGRINVGDVPHVAANTMKDKLVSAIRAAADSQ